MKQHGIITVVRFFRVTRQLAGICVILTMAAGYISGCRSKSERTEETASPPAQPAEISKDSPGESPKTGSDDSAQELSLEDRKALEDLEKAISNAETDKKAQNDTDLLKGVLGKDSALKVPEVRDSTAPQVYGASIPVGALPFDAQKALAYLDQLISFQLDFRVTDERISEKRRVMVDIGSKVRRTSAGDFSFEQLILQTPTGSTPSKASLMAIRTPGANFLKISDAPWWRYPPNQTVRLERYLDLRLVEKVLQNSVQLGNVKASPVTYQGRSATRYRLEKRPGEIPPAFAAFNPKVLDVSSEMTIDDGTGLMLKLDYALSSRYDPGAGDTAESVSVRLAVSEIGGINEILPPDSFVEGPVLGNTGPERPR